MKTSPGHRTTGPLRVAGLLALLGLLVAPLLFSWRARAFERTRWAESDYGPSGKGETEEDHD